MAVSWADLWVVEKVVVRVVSKVESKVAPMDGKQAVLKAFAMAGVKVV